MAKDNKQTSVVVVPDDYRPKTPLDFMAIYLEHEDGIKLLTDEQAGKVFKALFRYAKDYSNSYDDSLMVNTDGMEPMAAYIAGIVAGGIRRAAQSGRRTSYLRSGANGGGRPAAGGE